MQQQRFLLLSLATWTALCMSTAMLSGTNDDDEEDVVTWDAADVIAEPEVGDVTTPEATASLPSLLRRLSSSRVFSWSANVMDEVRLDGSDKGEVNWGWNLATAGRTGCAGWLGCSTTRLRMTSGANCDLESTLCWCADPLAPTTWSFLKWLKFAAAEVVAAETTYPLSLSGVASRESSRLSSGYKKE